MTCLRQELLRQELEPTHDLPLDVLMADYPVWAKIRRHFEYSWIYESAREVVTSGLNQIEDANSDQLSLRNLCLDNLFPFSDWQFDIQQSSNNEYCICDSMETRPSICLFYISWCGFDPWRWYAFTCQMPFMWSVWSAMLSDRNLYSCPQQPRHMSVAIDEMNYVRVTLIWGPSWAGVRIGRCLSMCDPPLGELCWLCTVANLVWFPGGFGAGQFTLVI